MLGLKPALPSERVLRFYVTINFAPYTVELRSHTDNWLERERCPCDVCLCKVLFQHWAFAVSCHKCYGLERMRLSQALSECDRNATKMTSMTGLASAMCSLAHSQLGQLAGSTSLQMQNVPKLTRLLLAEALLFCVVSGRAEMHALPVAAVSHRP